MFFFKKHPTYQSSGFFNGFTDYHCHILPGVDDGVKTMNQALEILAEYERLGVETVWLTPHVMEDVPNTTEGLRLRFQALKAAYTGGVDLHLAAEYMLDGLFDQRLSSSDLLPLGANSDMVLVETSYFNPPLNMEATLHDIMSHGFFPVLAHPERYRYIADIEGYRRLKRMGVKFQMNLGSIAEVYGTTARKKALMLMKEGAYDYTGTDLHNIHLLHTILETKIPK
ncbi:MAG: capsular biosynthesis protein [Bacteroidaceae bacterium]|nr:capsular biosynthesis protein [Bacteroidaceae bacterium]